MINNGICERLECYHNPVCWFPEIYKSGNCNFLIWFNQDVLPNRVPWYDADIIENIDDDADGVTRGYNNYIITKSRLRFEYDNAR